MSGKDHNIKNATLKIAAVEKDFDVCCVVFKGLKIWPLIRNILYDQLFWNKEDSVSDGLVRFNSPKYNRNFPEFPAKIKRTDIMWMSEAWTHTDRIAGKYYTRFDDPFIEFFDYYTVNKFEFNSKLSVERKPRLHEPYYLSPQIEYSAIPKSSFSEIENFEQLSLVVKNICNVQLAQEDVLQKVATVISYTVYFLDLLHIVKPKAVFLVCYYSPKNMALIRACNMLGIPTVEYQHGKQGKYHCMYTHWTSIPVEGYELLPRFFWNWGEESAQNISRWMGTDNPKHSTIVGGSLWLGLWVHRKWPEETSVVRDYERFFAGKKVILVSLQGFEKLLSEDLVTAMRNSPDDWVWMLRLPPGLRYREDELLADLSKNQIENYEIDIANRASLYTLLRRVEQHVTYFSSVCYEALSFGINSIVLYPTVKDLYAEYLVKGYFIYAKDAKELIYELQRTIDGPFVKEEEPYILSDLKVVRKTVSSILALDRIQKQ